MLLVIDIGNTNIVYGVYQGNQLLAHWRGPTNREQSAAGQQGFLLKSLRERQIEPLQLHAAAIASVVPVLSPVMQAAIGPLITSEPLMVHYALRTGLKIRYDHPEKLGADRLANAVAAYTLYGGPLIVLDCGTATKLCAITKGGTYLGGVIAPGLKTLAASLSASADQLPQFELVKPPAVIGANTIHCLQSGIINGQIMMLKGLIAQMRREMKAPAAQVVATGGLIGLLSASLPEIEHINPCLTLEGLKIIHDLNR
jgi:type III pantothenate kinase